MSATFNGACDVLTSYPLLAFDSGETTLPPFLCDLLPIPHKLSFPVLINSQYIQACAQIYNIPTNNSISPIPNTVLPNAWWEHEDLDRKTRAVSEPTTNKPHISSKTMQFIIMTFWLARDTKKK